MRGFRDSLRVVAVRVQPSKQFGSEITDAIVARDYKTVLVTIKTVINWDRRATSTSSR